MIRFLAALALIVPIAAQAQQVCAPRPAILATLAANYGEVVRSAGIAGNGGLLEITVSMNGKWSILLTMPGGPACFMAAGTGFQFIAAPADKKHERNL